jgi:hypothetical protein
MNLDPSMEALRVKLDEMEREVHAVWTGWRKRPTPKLPYGAESKRPSLFNRLAQLIRGR